MAQATFIHDGSAIDYTPGADVAVGDVVVQGELVGVAKQAIKANTLGALAVTGVFDLPKAPGASINPGVSLYWDAGNQFATPDSNSGEHKRLGNAVAAAGSADTMVRARLNSGITDYSPLVVPG